ncbi:MAG: potassium-transporting ATPase subunit KdpB [Bdellovibrionales bacterium]|nr:potassium-transporting ATPase subunit KdpB [Bdellovibrionales bacterium]
MKTNTSPFGDRTLLRAALQDSFKKLSPRVQKENFVMLVVLIGAALTLVVAGYKATHGQHWGFDLHISLWLWFTVLFANFAESIAEGRGKAQAESLRKARSDIWARVWNEGQESKLSATELRPGMVVICEGGDLVPGDGEIIEGIASIDESAITGESAPVVRAAGGDRSAVTGGTRVLSDRILIRITSQPGDTFIDRMIRLVEGAQRQKTPNERALSILLTLLTLVFLVAVFTMKPLAHFVGADESITFASLVALLVCLIPTTIGGLLSAIGISGMDRLLRRNVVATSGRAVEAAGDIDVLLLDKTGTITFGNRRATAFHTAPGVPAKQLAQAAAEASAADDTAEGRSIVEFAEKHGIPRPQLTPNDKSIEFSAKTRMSGVDFASGRQLRKGAADSIEKWVASNGAAGLPAALKQIIERVAKAGATPLLVADKAQILGVVELSDVIKPGIRDRFERLRAMGIRTVMITGDNPLTAASIAAQAGVDDFMAEATPEAKLGRIQEEQQRGHLVAMVGDGTNDAPALAQSDVGIAMNTGTQAAREAGNMVDLDSDPTKLMDVVEIGKQLLMTRGALTTFSIANDVAKYFAILPALFLTAYASTGSTSGPLAALNLMHLATPQSAILSAVIFNALIIIALIPLALRGVEYKPGSANSVLARNLWIYGLGGLVAPFIGIKAIDLLLVAGGLA